MNERDTEESNRQMDVVTRVINDVSAGRRDDVSDYHRRPQSGSGNTWVEAGIVFVTASAGIVWISRAADPGAPLVIGVYGIIALTYLFVKLLAAFRYQTYQGSTPSLSVAVVVPAFNEDPEMLARCLRSIACQTVQPAEIFVVDDGSADESTIGVARRALEGMEGVFLKRFHRNRGKRLAQGWAFQRIRADVVLTVDSDTILDPRCIENGLKPFMQPDVMAVCGNVRVLNRTRNLLTRLLDLRYTNAFVYERAAYSTIDSMLCATGVYTFYRQQLIEDNLDDYLNQTFLGVVVSYGDDRRLTNYALGKGRVVFQDSAMVATLAPERMGHFLRQQSRWNKSFFRETLYAIRNLPRRRAVWWLAVSELALWLFFSWALIAALVFRPVLAGQFLGYYYAGFLVLMAYARSARHATRRFGVFLLAPIYAALPHPHPHPSQGVEPAHTPQRRMGHPHHRHRSICDTFRP